MTTANETLLLEPAAPAAPSLSLRTIGNNPNHHLWNNNGTWYLHYTIHPTPFTKERVRRSLGTRCLETARRLRDEYLKNF